MHERTLWSKQDQHQGDRWRLFRAVGDSLDASEVLVSRFLCGRGPFLRVAVGDLRGSDKRAKQFFADDEGVREIVAEHDPPVDDLTPRFVQADYSGPLGSFGRADLLISLYAGFVSSPARLPAPRWHPVGQPEPWRRRHGLDRRALRALGRRCLHEGRKSRVTADDLASYLIPKKPLEITREYLHSTGRGVAYTKPAFVQYLFTRRR
ncbi:MAG: hypothetical protein R2716_09730 [Microthrixaceae bacterium]